MTKTCSQNQPNTFNVLDFGAVGDDKTDNTEAFLSCLQAFFLLCSHCVSAGNIFFKHVPEEEKYCVECLILSGC